MKNPSNQLNGDPQSYDGRVWLFPMQLMVFGIYAFWSTYRQELLFWMNLDPIRTRLMGADGMEKPSRTPGSLHVVTLRRSIGSGCLLYCCDYRAQIGCRDRLPDLQIDLIVYVHNCIMKYDSKVYKGHFQDPALSALFLGLRYGLFFFSWWVAVLTDCTEGCLASTKWLERPEKSTTTDDEFSLYSSLLARSPDKNYPYQI